MNERVSCRMLVEQELLLAGWSLCDEGFGYVFSYAGHECVVLLETVSRGAGDTFLFRVSISTMLSRGRVLGNDAFLRRCNGRRVSVVRISVQYDDSGDARLEALFRCFAFLGCINTAVGICAITPFMELLDSCDVLRTSPESNVLQLFSLDHVSHRMH